MRGGADDCQVTSLTRNGLVFKAHRLLYPSTLGSRVIKKPDTKRTVQGALARWHRGGWEMQRERVVPGNAVARWRASNLEKAFEMTYSFGS